MSPFSHINWLIIFSSSFIVYIGTLLLIFSIINRKWISANYNFYIFLFIRFYETYICYNIYLSKFPSIQCLDTLTFFPLSFIWLFIYYNLFSDYLQFDLYKKETLHKLNTRFHYMKSRTFTFASVHPVDNFSFF